MEQILTGFRAAMEIEINCRNVDKEVWDRSRWLRWAGYDLCETAAPLGQQHLTRIQLYRAVGSHTYEYVLPGGLSTSECDDLCCNVIGDNYDTDQKQELLVTSALASMLHAEGVSLEYHVVDFACGRATVVDEPFPYEHAGRHLLGLEPVNIVPASLPTTLHAAVRNWGWKATVEWLHDLHATLEQGLEEIRMGLAVWVPAIAPRQPWEPLILHHDGQNCRRLAWGAEAAAYAGRCIDLAVPVAKRADWLTFLEAAVEAEMCPGRFRRWLMTYERLVRIGRPTTRDGQFARNRRLVHRGDLRRAIRFSKIHKTMGEDICVPHECWMSCNCASDCPDRKRPPRP